VRAGQDVPHTASSRLAILRVELERAGEREGEMRTRRDRGSSSTTSLNLSAAGRTRDERKGMGTASTASDTQGCYSVRPSDSTSRATPPPSSTGDGSHWTAREEEAQLGVSMEYRETQQTRERKRRTLLEARRPLGPDDLEPPLALLLHSDPLQHLDIVLVRDAHARERVDDLLPAVGALARDHDRLGERVLDLVVGEPERARDLGHLLHQLEVLEVFLRAKGVEDERQLPHCRDGPRERRRGRRRRTSSMLRRCSLVNGLGRTSFMPASHTSVPDQSCSVLFHEAGEREAGQADAPCEK